MGKVATVAEMGGDSAKHSGGALKVLLAFLVVLVLVLTVVIGGLLFDRYRSGGGADAPASTSESSPSESSTLGSSTSEPPPTDDGKDVEVTAGEGGSDVSPIDGKTKIGYEPTCTGAVQAATNYLTDLDVGRVHSGGLTVDVYFKLIADRAIGNFKEQNTSKGNHEFLEELEGFEGGEAIIKPEWGGFVINACEPGKSAEIYLAYAQGTDGENYHYFSQANRMEWVDDDWKIASYGSDVEIPVELPGMVTEPDPHVLTQLGNRTQWQTYENAGE